MIPMDKDEPQSLFLRILAIISVLIAITVIIIAGSLKRSRRSTEKLRRQHLELAFEASESAQLLTLDSDSG